MLKGPPALSPLPLDGEGVGGWGEGTTHQTFAPEAPTPHHRAKHLRATPTWTEAKLWQALRHCPVRIRRQVPLGPYIADFACHRARLVIELDGGIHTRSDVALRDHHRDQYLASKGYRTLRIDARRIPHDLDAVVCEIHHAIRQKLPRAIAPLPLDGEGVGGWGEPTPHPTLAPEAPPPHRLPHPPTQPPATTPTQPSPIEGEGL